MDRFKSIKLASILGILFNMFLLIIKGITGLMTNSQSMIADAFNSAGDIFSSLMTFIGNKIASKPCDEDHNLGHGKAEYIYSMIISIVMIFTSLLVCKNSIFSMFNKSKYNFSYYLALVCIITIIIKFLLYLYTNKLSKKYNSLLLNANSKDHRNDTIITIFNLLSCYLSYNNIYFIDGIVGALISLWILLTSIKIFKESYDILMDKSICDNSKNQVFKIIEKYKEVKKVIHFNSTPVGYKYQISFTIYVDGNMSTFKSHEIADKLEKEITGTIDDIYLTVIHVNPI